MHDPNYLWRHQGNGDFVLGLESVGLLNKDFRIRDKIHGLLLRNMIFNMSEDEMSL